MGALGHVPVERHEKSVEQGQMKAGGGPITRDGAHGIVESRTQCDGGVLCLQLGQPGGLHTRACRGAGDQSAGGGHGGE